MKKILFSVLLAFMTLSCGNNFVSPSSYTKEQIDKKYPYWKVGVENFFIYVNQNKDQYIELSVAEKRRYLQSLALMRVAVNADEFVEVMRAEQANFKADQTVNDPNAVETTIKEQPLKVDRIIEVIRATEYNVIYGKGDHTGEAAYAFAGTYYYSYYGSSVPLSPGKRIYTPNRYIVDWYGIVTFSALIFHEHLHNIGFTHSGVKPDIVYAIAQGPVEKLMGRIIEGDLKEKYRRALDEVTAYYMTEYKQLLMSSTIYTPSKE